MRGILTVSNAASIYYHIELVGMTSQFCIPFSHELNIQWFDVSQADGGGHPHAMNLPFSLPINTGESKLHMKALFLRHTHAYQFLLS